MREWIGYKKGINFGGWFSQCDHTEKHYDNFIGEKDFMQVSKMGFDHIRLPIDYNVVQCQDGCFIDKGFSYIDRIIEWCHKYNLNLIIDLHKAVGYSFDVDENESGFFDEPEYQELFYALWREMARRYAKYAPNVAFELLNEVVDKECCDKWNEIARQCIDDIRTISKDVVISVGGYWNNDILAVKDLLMPPDDNIVYNVHCYAPHIFTHQGASWMEMMSEEYRCKMAQSLKSMRIDCERNMPYTLAEFDGVWDSDKVVDSKYFIDLFKVAVNVAKERNVPLYCGEYGVINRADNADIIKWYDAIHMVFEKFGIGRAAWCYRGLNFGVADEQDISFLSKLKF